MKNLLLISLLIVLSGCLRTRAELGGTEQSAVYSQKQADNQAEAQAQGASGAVVTQTQLVDDKDELIRVLNGRVEVLENQLTELQKERELERHQTQEKLVLMHEALKKLEAQVNGVETPAASADSAKPSTGEPVLASSDEQELKKIGSAAAKNNSEKPKAETKPPANSYEAGEEHFTKKEWKRAILSFHKFTDEAPKSKLVPDAKYKIGLSFQELGMKEEAMAYFEEVVANYGATDAGKKAKSRLSKMKK